MTDLYCIDLKGISLEQFRHMLETKNILPGRKILLEQLDERLQRWLQWGSATWVI